MSQYGRSLSIFSREGIAFNSFSLKASIQVAYRKLAINGAWLNGDYNLLDTMVGYQPARYENNVLSQSSIRVRIANDTRRIVLRGPVAD
jgi:hypothetical protein